MTKHYKILFFMLLPILGVSQSEQLANFQGAERQGAVSLSLSSYGYAGLGNNGSTYYSDFWRYNPADDSWTELAPFPGESRSYAVALAIDGYVYVGLGSKYAGGTTFYSDFYKYSPTENEWTAIASFGGGERSSAVAFVIDNFAYVGTGSSPDGDKKDFWKYSPVENTWDQVADAPDAKNSAMGFSINGKGYLVAGITYSPYTNQYSDVQEYSPTENTWTERIFADGINLSFHGATSFVLNGIAYIAYGNKDFVTTYNPNNNQISNKGDLIGIETSRDKPCSFVIDGVAYFGMGSWMESWSNTIYYNDMWKYTSPPPEPEVLNLTGGGSYCEGATPTGISAQIEGSQMQITYQLKKDGSNFGDPIEGNGSTISWDNLEAGSYTAIASNGQDEVTMNGTVVVEQIAYVDATIEIDANALDVCQGQSVTITASITNGGSSPSFKWLVNDVEQGGQSETLVYEPTNNDRVVCELTSDLMCVNQNPIVSNELEFIVNEIESVSIEISAESLVVCSGNEITITADATNGGESPMFIWMVNSQNQNHNQSTFTYTPANGDKVICNLVPDIACPSETMVSSNELEIEVNDCTGVQTLGYNSISVYPNPATSNATIEMLDGDMIKSISIVALDGKILQQIGFAHQASTQTINLSDVPKGTYIIVIEGEKQKRTYRLLKE